MITSEIGPDGLRDCFRSPIPEIFEAASLLDGAVSAHLRGHTATAERLLRAADMPIIGEWLDSIWMGGSKNPYRAVRQAADLPPILSKPDRHKPRDATDEMKQALVARDGHHCRLCGISVGASCCSKRTDALLPGCSAMDGHTRKSAASRPPSDVAAVRSRHGPFARRRNDHGESRRDVPGVQLRPRPLDDVRSGTS